MSRAQQSAHEAMQTAALYIHIPFCEKRCNYCDFYTVANRKEAIPRYLQALEREMALYAGDPFWSRQTFATVFFGGGTPSLLSPEDIGRILEAVHSHFRLTPRPEITLEANPGTTTAAHLSGYRAAGINRLSLGAQSFWDDELEQLDRLHRSADIVRTVEEARAAGFDNINLDLMFALPGQRPSRWKTNLERALELQPQHLSCYNLTLEEGTPLFKLFQAGKVRALTEWRERVLFNFTIDFLEARGFRHYEVSNYALPGYECQHNIKYWDGSVYLGLGASAHSFDGRTRFWNVSNYVHYCERLEKGKHATDARETLTPEQQRFEAVFLGLRRYSGVDLNRFQQIFHRDFWHVYGRQVERLLQHQPPLVEIRDDHLRLTREGWLLCDAVCAEFA